MTTSKRKIVIENVFKVFGDNVPAAIKLIESAESKSDILAKTGCVVGVNDISLNIDSGEIFVIMGLSGSGKSTLVRHFNRLIDPTSGHIYVDGEDILQYNPNQLRQFRRNKISMVFQSFGLLPHKTVLDNVAYGLKVRGESKAYQEEKANYWIDTVGLKGYESRYPAQLSGGMRQRVGLARALAADTDIILMDEPCSALDPIATAVIEELIDEALVVVSGGLFLQYFLPFAHYVLSTALSHGKAVLAVNLANHSIDYHWSLEYRLQLIGTGS